MTRIVLDQVIEAAPARVVLTRGAGGAVTRASFDLAGLPRVDAALVGRRVAEVPDLVARLCGICPSAHHLAGIRALESLAGVGGLTATAQAVRRLLHHAGVVSIHVAGLVAGHQNEALLLRRFAKAVMAAAGSPGHFPVTAVPGGVVAPVAEQDRDACLALADDALAAARRVAEQALGGPVPPDRFDGADVALIDDAGGLDLFGQALRAVAADGTVLVPAGTPADFDALVAESHPGSSAPKPYLVSLGAGRGAYRVGPVAQLRVGPVRTPLAAQLQAAWRQGPGGAASARAIMVVHAVEVIKALLQSPELTAGETSVEWPGTLPAGVGVGWVDGARGLLVHRYAATADGRMAAATILTPTAQNEPWLDDLLRAAGPPEGGSNAGLEDAIREADPCLPCSSVPPGTMDLVVEVVQPGSTD